METGLILALISSVSFAAGIVMVRKTAGEAGESFSVTAISIFTGIPFFALVILLEGEWEDLFRVSWEPYALLAATGVIHFIIGRLLAYNSFRLIGANRATPFNQTSPIYTIILSMVFLQEDVTVFIILGAACMLAGAFLITREKRSFSGEKREKLSGPEIKGILLASGAALCWGITPVLIKPAVEEIGSSAAGTFVAYVMAAVVMAFLLFKNGRWNRLIKLPVKNIILPMAVAAILTAVGQLLYFSALGRSPANIIAPLLSSQVLFIFLFSFFLNRKIELFTPRVIAGAAAIVAGTVLLFL